MDCGVASATGVNTSDSLPQSMCLRDVASRMCSRIQRDEVEKWALAATPLRIGTMFSGTDIVVSSARAALSLFCGARLIDHVFSCDHKKSVQDWILSLPEKPRRLFCEAADLGCGKAYCAIAKAVVPVEPVDLLYAGFSCTSLSDNNGQRQTFREAFAAGNFKKAGESGKTFSALMEFLANAPEKPQAIILENVRGINKGPLGIRPLDVSAYFLLMTC
jgi:hypothetical protein